MSAKYNENVAALIAAFAKSAKISKAKAEKFALDIIAEVKPQGGGRPAGAETLALREKFMTYVSGVNTFTSKQVADALECEPVEVNNCIAYFNRDGADVFVQVGTIVEPGKRGRRPIVWAMRENYKTEEAQTETEAE
jgi:hypothetical protein